MVIYFSTPAARCQELFYLSLFFFNCSAEHPTPALKRAQGDLPRARFTRALFNQQEGVYL